MEEAMKTVASVLCLLVFAVLAHAGTEMRIESGEILVSPSVWTAVGVKVSKEAQMYPDAVSEAFRSPGKTIPVQEKASVAVVDLFHYRKDITTTLGVRYDTTEAVVDVQRMDERLEAEDLFFPYLIFWLISVVAFFVFRNMHQDDVVGAFEVAFSIAFAAGVFAAMAAVAPASGVGAIDALVAAFLLPASSSDDMISKVSSILFYMLMIVSAGAVYSPLFL